MHCSLTVLVVHHRDRRRLPRQVHDAIRLRLLRVRHVDESHPLPGRVGVHQHCRPVRFVVRDGLGVGRVVGVAGRIDLLADVERRNTRENVLEAEVGGGGEAGGGEEGRGEQARSGEERRHGRIGV